MAIEIRELVIKTTIIEHKGVRAEAASAPELKDEILAACRQLVLNMLRERRER
nr:DUF5908 family protein [uncultured Duganella sp.]